MLYAVLARCPVFGGKVASFDATKAKAVPGVKQVVQISSGVAVVADNTWSAMEGRKRADSPVGRGPERQPQQRRHPQDVRRISPQKPGAVARNEGDAAAALAGAAKKIEAVYEAPYLGARSHGADELHRRRARRWLRSLGVHADADRGQADRGARSPAFLPTRSRSTPVSGRRIRTPRRRDFVAEAVEISKAIGAPVKLTWSREDDMQHELYRPASYAKFAGGLDADGWPVAWTTRVVCPSFGGLRNGVDRTSVEGIDDLHYAIPNIQVDYHRPTSAFRSTYWRSVGYSQNTFFIGELPR